MQVNPHRRHATASRASTRRTVRRRRSACACSARSRRWSTRTASRCRRRSRPSNCGAAWLRRHVSTEGRILERATAPGELVRTDHMTVRADGVEFKEFRAACPFTRRMFARVHSRATAFNARRFFRELVAFMRVHSAQVDGGSEFMAEFEDECAKRVELAVLPPNRPSSTAASNAPTAPRAPSSGASAPATSPLKPSTPNSTSTSATTTTKDPTPASA